MCVIHSFRERLISFHFFFPGIYTTSKGGGAIRWQLAESARVHLLRILS